MAHMQVDPDDLFRVSCERTSTYPQNLPYKDQYGHRLDALDKQLTNDQDRVWDEEGVISLRDLCDTNDTFEEVRFGDTTELHLYLQRRSDLRCRYGFITALDSREPLECTLDMYKHLATYHQIPPPFIDCLLSFGRQHLPRDFSLTQFEHHDTLLTPKELLLPLKSPNRSGREIRLFFNMRAIEPSTSEKDWLWSMRNVAAYHSFDVETGRAFWLHVKANEAIDDRIAKSTLSNLYRPKALETLEGSFRASLDTFFTFFDWADGNWRDYINALDEALRNIIIKAKTAQVDKFAKMPEDLMQSLSRRGTTDPVDSLPRGNSFAAGVRTLSNLFQKKSTNAQPGLSLRELPRKLGGDTGAGPLVGGATTSDESEKRLKSIMVLETFTFDEMQKLQVIGERIQEALLVVKMNRSTMKEIREYYDEIVNSSEFPQKLHTACAADFTSFKRKVKNIERNLGARHAQLETLARNLQEGKVLFDGILQYRSVQISRLFAESAFVSSQRMERIAFKTEQETASMHIITIVTLLFLPGTFIAVRLFQWVSMVITGWFLRLLESAQGSTSSVLTQEFIQTFFQSGIIQLKQLDDPNADWLVLDPAMVLFERICFPMMAGIFLVWFFIYTWVRKRSKNRPHDNSSNV